jgi:transcriptional regulator with XRE-family HTH domain
MEIKVSNPKHQRNILDNIRKLRKLKGIKSETIANEIGISPAEYSKLENGNKKNWEKHLNSIAYILNIDPFELIFENCLKENFGNEMLKGDIEGNQKNYLKKILDENQQLKQEILNNYKNSKEYWEEEYKKLKVRLEIAESKLNNQSIDHLKSINTKLDLLLNPNNAGKSSST